MAGQDWYKTKTNLQRLQDLVSQGFMTAAELASSRVPVALDAPEPSEAEGYVVAFEAFYERGFGMPAHPFLGRLLHHYRLELHHLTPSGILFVASFVTLCEAYMGIEPHFDLWNYFFRVRRPQSGSPPLTVCGGAVFYVKTGGGTIPYFDLPMPTSMKGWRSRWFFVKNEGEDPLPAFTGRPPVPFHNWGYGVAARDRKKLDDLLPVIQQLREQGLTGVHLLRTFFSRRIQPLRVRRHRMSLYRGPSDPDRSFSEEPSEGQVDQWVRQAIERNVDPRPGAGPEPLRHGMPNPWVSVCGTLPDSSYP